MAENLIISDGSKEEKYAVLYEQIKALAEGENDIIANMANISSMIHQTFGFWWTGFYRVCWDRSKARLPAAGSDLDEEYAELHGRKPKRSWYPT